MIINFYFIDKFIMRVIFYSVTRNIIITLKCLTSPYRLRSMLDFFFFALDQKHRNLFAQIRNQRIVGIHVISLFGVFFALIAWQISDFMENRNKQPQIFLSLSECADGSYEFNSRKLVNVWWSERVGIIMLMFQGMQSHFVSNVFCHHPHRGI